MSLSIVAKSSTLYVCGSPAWIRLCIPKGLVENMSSYEVFMIHLWLYIKNLEVLLQFFLSFPRFLAASRQELERKNLKSKNLGRYQACIMNLIAKSLKAIILEVFCKNSSIIHFSQGPKFTSPNPCQNFNFQS